MPFHRAYCDSCNNGFTTTSPQKRLKLRSADHNSRTPERVELLLRVLPDYEFHGVKESEISIVVFIADVGMQVRLYGCP